MEKVCLFRSAFTLRLSTSLGLIKKKNWFLYNDFDFLSSNI